MSGAASGKLRGVAAGRAGCQRREVRGVDDERGQRREVRGGDTVEWVGWFISLAAVARGASQAGKRGGDEHDGAGTGAGCTRQREQGVRRAGIHASVTASGFG
jgi:hypothetical protein